MSVRKVLEVGLLLLVVLAMAGCRIAEPDRAATPDAVEVELASDGDLPLRVLALEREVQALTRKVRGLEAEQNSTFGLSEVSAHEARCHPPLFQRPTGDGGESMFDTFDYGPKYNDHNHYVSSWGDILGGSHDHPDYTSKGHVHEEVAC